MYTTNIIEYKMPEEMYKEYTKGYNGGDIQKYLCDIVNNEFRLLGYCVNVIKG